MTIETGLNSESLLTESSTNKTVTKTLIYIFQPKKSLTAI